MKTIRLKTFETNSSSTHTLTITSGKTWDEFQAGTAMYCKEFEQLYDSKQLYDMFVEGDNDGDYKCDEYEEYRNKLISSSPLTYEEFLFVLQNEKVAAACFTDKNYNWPCEFSAELNSKFGSETHLNKDVLYFIGKWLYEYGMQSYKEWIADDNEGELEWFASEDVFDGVRVVAFGKYGYC